MFQKFFPCDSIQNRNNRGEELVMIDLAIAIILLSPCVLFMALGYFGKN